MANVDGISTHRNEVRRLQRAGAISGIMRGEYLSAPVDPYAVLRFVASAKPEWIIDGQTVLEIEAGDTPTFPIRATCPPTGREVSTPFLSVKRSRKRWSRKSDLGRLAPVLHAIVQVERTEAIDFLRRRFTKNTVRLEQEISVLKPVPRSAMQLIEEAGLNADSPPERTLIAALLKAGYALESNRTLFGYRWDIMLRRYKLLIEIDGYQYHRGESRETFVRDRWKQNVAVGQGWRVLRFSASCIDRHLDRVLAIIAAVTARTPAAVDLEPVWNWHNYFSDLAPYERTEFY